MIEKRFDLKSLIKRVPNRILIGVGLLALLSIGFIFSEKLFFSSKPSPAPSPKILYWIDPMEPHVHYERPGKSRMNMDLVPVYEEKSQDISENQTTLKISPAVVNNLGVRTALVEESPINLTVRAFGSVQADENKVSHIHAYVEGWIEKLHTKELQETVEKDQPLFEIYSRDLLLAQKEYLLAIRNKEKTASAASINKLKALGMSDKQIEQLQETQQANSLVTIYAPHKGYIDNLNIREGMWVKPETTIMSLTDASSIWVIAEIFPTQLPLIKKGQAVKIYFPQAPQQTLQGKVDYIYPEIDPVSLTAKARILLDNPEHPFKPHMYVAVEFESEPKKTLHIPSQAVIWDHRQARVIVALEEGKFQPRDVTTGIESGESIEILSGLHKGEKIVTSAQFLLDSEIQMKSALQRMEEPISSHHHAHSSEHGS